MLAQWHRWTAEKYPAIMVRRTRQGRNPEIFPLALTQLSINLQLRSNPAPSANTRRAPGVAFQMTIREELRALRLKHLHWALETDLRTRVPHKRSRSPCRPAHPFPRIRKKHRRHDFLLVRSNGIPDASPHPPCLVPTRLVCILNRRQHGSVLSWLPEPFLR